MKHKPQKLGEWQEREAVTRRNIDEAADKIKKDSEAYSYEVHTDGQKIEVKNRDEAIKLAKQTNGKVLELIEGCGLGYIFPAELVFNPDVE